MLSLVIIFSRNFIESEIRIGVVWRSLCLDDENQYEEWRKNRNSKSSQDAVDILKKKLEADKKPVPSRIFSNLNFLIDVI